MDDVIQKMPDYLKGKSPVTTSPYDEKTTKRSLSPAFDALPPVTGALQIIVALKARNGQPLLNLGRDFTTPGRSDLTAAAL